MGLDTDTIRQAAAIPLRDGQICLVTSRSGKRWVIPKGGMEPGKTASEIALQEAWEEAGLAGVLHEPVGSYFYEKFGSTHHVLVFVLRVTEEAADWPEISFRQRCWLPIHQALQRIDDPGLQEILRSLVVREKDNSRRVKIP